MKHPFLHGAHNAGRFQDQSVVDRYHLRPAYPPETFGTSIGHGGEFDQPPANACRADFLLIRV
jgi:hypothetical protein